MDRDSVFEKTYAGYLDRIGRIDLVARAGILGIEVEQGMARIVFFGEVLRVSGTGVTDAAGRRPDFATCVILFKYLLLCPEAEVPVTDWAHYRDFRESGPLTVYYAHDVEQALADCFSGRLDLLNSGARALGGRQPDIDAVCDVTFSFQALPRIPLLLMFNDADEEFPADCSVLFGNSAEHYLDGESLAILGRCLFERLRKKGTAADRA